MYHSTESARVADLVLPAAGWGEKDGCFINSERRIGTLKAVRKAPGQALSDFRIFRLIAEAWGCGRMFEKWTHPEAVFRILRDLTKDRPCDITGIEGYAHLDSQGGIQWPWPAGHSITETNPSPPGERRLFEDGVFFTRDGKAPLLFSPPRDLPEPPDPEYPFMLLTGRGTSSQWHTLTRTGKSDILTKLSPARAYVEIHPEDALALGLDDGANAIVRSRRGEMQAAVYHSPTVGRGQVFIPMHYHGLNRITHPSFDPHSRQPNYKASAVAIAKLP
jgi:assimilatory nitrate reductase catalytic subunit